MKSMFALFVGRRLKNQMPKMNKMLMIMSKEISVSQPPLRRKDGEHMMHTPFGH